MQWQKFKATYIFDGQNFLDAGRVVVCDDEGAIADAVPESEAGDEVQELAGILLPAFINCHCHLELSHMKGLIPEKTGLVDFVFSVIKQRQTGSEEIMAAITNAEAEMYKNGIAAVGDICNNLHTLAQKERQNLCYYNFVESSGWLPGVAEARFERSKNDFDFFAALSPSAIVPHAPYSVSENLWRLMQPYFKGRVVSIHNQETSSEDEFFIQNTGDLVRMYTMMNLDISFYQPGGKSSLQTYFHKLHEAAQVILVHNTFTTQADIDYARQSRHGNTTWYCLCPNANMYIENALPPVDLLRKNSCGIVLGTDSLASNHSLSILDEMKTIQKHFPAVPLCEMLGWATLNGAKALQMQDISGSLQKGKKPGLILIENATMLKLDSDSSVRRLL